MPYHPSIFEQINSKTVRKSTMKTHRSLRSRCVRMEKDNNSLQLDIHSALRINCEDTLYKASKILPHENLSADNSYRLKTLDKNLGVRPMGIGEVLRKIIGKIITQCLKSGLKNLGKSFQLCFGQKCGIENAIHRLSNEFEKPERDAILIIDAENAFNSLNRELALKKFRNPLSGTASCAGQLIQTPLIFLCQ